MPPLVGAAVKFTAVPEQTVVLLAEIDTEGVILKETVMATALLVADVVEAHAALLVITTLIASLFTGAARV